jgi:hypothetical protein
MEKAKDHGGTSACRCPLKRTEIAFLPLAATSLPDVVAFTYFIFSLV